MQGSRGWGVGDGGCRCRMSSADGVEQVSKVESSYVALSFSAWSFKIPSMVDLLTAFMACSRAHDVRVHVDGMHLCT